MIDGVPRPDHGPDHIERVCTTCQASWVGDPLDHCAWCHRRAQLDLELARSELLHPRHLVTDRGNPNYDRLDDTGKAVWDRTRGHRRGHDSTVLWISRLRQAVDQGWITPTEAEQAMRRIVK